MKPYSISLHNGTNWSRAHNARRADLARKEEHIDERGYHRSIIDIPIAQSYKETFGRALMEYNLKQTRSDRIIHDYLSKVREEHRRSPTKKPHASYEMIVEIGNREHHPSLKEAEKALNEWLIDFRKNNPNVVVFGAYFHADEPDAGPHLHVDYYFVKRENKRGLDLQVSQNGALNEQGYFPIKENGKMVTPQTQFVRDSRELLREVAKRRGLFVEDKTQAGAKREHLETSVFKKQTEIKNAKKELKKTTEALESAKVLERESRTKAQNNEARVKRAEEREKALESEIKDLQSKLGDLQQQDYTIRSLKAENEQLERENSMLKQFLKTAKEWFVSFSKEAWQELKSWLHQDMDERQYKLFEHQAGEQQRNDYER